MMSNSPRRCRVRRLGVGCALAVVAVGLAGCGTYPTIPDGCRDGLVVNGSEKSFYRTFDFQYDRQPGANGAREPRGKVVVQVGGPEGNIDLSGVFVFDKLNTGSNVNETHARLTITFQPTDEQAARYREVVQTWKEKATEAEAARIADDARTPLVFNVTGVWRNRGGTDNYALDLILRQDGGPEIRLKLPAKNQP